MWKAIYEFLKKAAQTGGKTALKGGKALGKFAASQTDVGKLYNAFKSGFDKTGNTAAELKGTAFDIDKYGGNTAGVQGMGNVPVAPADYYKSPQAQIQDTNVPQSMLGSDRTALGKMQQLSQLGQSTPDTISQQNNGLTPKPSIIPAQYQQFIRQPGMEYTPMNPSPTIPQQYQGYGQQQAPQPGFIRGFTENLLGMPQTEALNNPDISTGRRTAYYAGGLIPNIVMSKLGQPSSAEAANQQALISQRQNMSNGQQVVDPETGQFLYNRPKGSVFKPESPEAKSQREVSTATKKESNVRAGKLNELNKAINFFETKINEIPGGEGFGGRLQGMQLATEGVLQTNPKVAAYMANVKGLRSQIARGLGEVGNLSEYEQQYAVALLPQVTDNLETRQQKLQNFRDYITAKIGTQQLQTEDPLGLR